MTLLLRENTFVRHLGAKLFRQEEDVYQNVNTLQICGFGGENLKHGLLEFALMRRDFLQKSTGFHLET